MRSEKKTLKSLETLRIFAAIAVVFSHAGMFSIPFINAFLGVHRFLGAIGVDVFFIVSGYVMYLSASSASVGCEGAARFLLNRVLRIFPLYLIVTGLWLVIELNAGVHFEMQYIVESLLLLPSKVGIQQKDPIVYLGWTLRFELYFYLLVSLGIALKSRLVFPITGIVVSFVIWLFNGYYFGAPIVLEFIGGFLLAFFMSRKPDYVVSSWRDFVGFFVSLGLLILASMGKDFGYDSGGIYTDVPRMWIVYQDKLPVVRCVAWGVPALMLVYFSIRLEDKWNWPFAKLGKYTFSLYLLQVFTNPLAESFQASMSDTWAFICGLGLLFVLTYASYTYFEKPILKTTLYRLKAGSKS
ncbi:acyltransferase [Bdellovibrio sp. SKB1291214]|uniref:acyltransferase family protein n=1 Tax=Bdellovibrio sp. SKB1291214 TaxID=1732569 RepID=UPI00223FE2B9|nr:acyltransferase [Bdellovibrio sp. SKB1291214]UYL08298.1 acyltransferase [Bdellovibrio sp. SKB1291214]